jgi:hypothetical protein
LPFIRVPRQDLRKIAPLISTRSEVEALLGPSQGAYFAVYKLKEGNLFIDYQAVSVDRNAKAEGTCRKTLL